MDEALKKRLETTKIRLNEVDNELVKEDVTKDIKKFRDLSKERANSIAAALTVRGIGSERFICKGSGGKKPIALNDTAEGKALNRRVEITILD